MSKQYLWEARATPVKENENASRKVFSVKYSYKGQSAFFEIVNSHLNK